MTRTEILAKLLALGPLSRSEIEQITHWPPKDVSEALIELRRRQVLRSSSVVYGYQIFSLAPAVPSPFRGAAA